MYRCCCCSSKPEDCWWILTLSFSDGNNIVVKLPEDRMGDVYVVVLEFDGAPVVEPEYIEPDGDGNYVLLEEDCIVYAAFDSRSYLSSQMNSWISWHVDVFEVELANAKVHRWSGGFFGWLFRFGGACGLFAADGVEPVRFRGCQVVREV